MRVLSIDEVKSLKTGQEVFLEEIGAVDSEESGERLIFRFEDAPEAVYLKDRTFAGYISFPEDVGLAQCSECKAIFRVTPRILKGDDERGLYFEEEYGYET